MIEHISKRHKNLSFDTGDKNAENATADNGPSPTEIAKPKFATADTSSGTVDTLDDSIIIFLEINNFLIYHVEKWGAL